MKLYTFAQAQKLLGFDKSYSREGQPAIYATFGSNVKLHVAETTYNGKQCLCLKPLVQLTIAGNRKDSKVVPVNIVNDKREIVAEGFIPANSLTIFLQSALDDESRLSVPFFFGKEAAFDAIGEMFPGFQEIAKAQGISLEQAILVLQNKAAIEHVNA